MTNEQKSDFGIIGLGVMGANLALNVEDHGFSVAVYDRSRAQTDKFVAKAAGQRVTATHSSAELVQDLAKPRRILVMVPAGAPVDATIDGLLPHLESGDVIIDGGNEFYTHTERRVEALQAKGIEFIGMGVSGGAEGARHGPSLMPGGHRDAYAKVSAIMEKIAAQVEDGPCVTYIGPGGAGHYVKMVHNGIEYGDMQLIAETYDLLKHVAGLTNDELADVFAEW
ncbi:MAG: NAD(P)-binding domain-containing protein, partial [Myxococcota bacterium]